ncbi:MAG TPA: tetratricopeptide repeat protein [Thermoanaerobaculia bacterium]|jgi:tetratricopeptide (TPR) repeat protein|nr:tetratricopeptide repeat protein [Thermoanaerobaculia bacterium]
MRRLALTLALLFLPGGIARAQDLARLLESGRQHLEAGRYPDAVASLEAAARLAPGSPDVHSMLGRAYLLNHQARPAADALERAIELGSQDPRTNLYLGSASWELSRLDMAEQQFRQALGSGSGAAALIALQQLGRLLLFQGRAADALDPLRRATVLLPDDVDLQLQLAQALEGAGQADEALAAYRKAAAMAPELARARYSLAQRLQRSGRKEEAAKEMETFRRLTAANEERVRKANLERARLDQGWELLRGGKSREAEALFAQLGPSPEALSGVAFSRSAAGDHKGAAEALEKAVVLAPERDDLRRALDEERLAAEGGKP